MSLENDGTGENGTPGRRRIHLREVSGDMDAPLGTVGQDLRAARLRRGDEIAQVSRALKIRKDHLDALENDRLEDLPGKTYAIGFVRSYARHLGLDAAHYVERFKQEIAGRPDEHAPPIAPIHQDERTLPHGWRIIAGVVLLMLLYGAWHLLSSGSDANQAVPPVPVIAQTRPAPTPVTQPVVIPADSATPSPALDTAAAPVATTPEQQTASATPPPAAGPATPATKPTPPAPVTQTQAAPPSSANAAAVPAVASGAAGQVYGAQNRSPRVILRARADTRLTVRSEDGTLYLNRDLKAGDSYQVPNITGLSMAASNAGAVEVNLDGIALGRAGQQSQVLGRVSLEPQSLMDRFNSR
jgi:cytoskeleton protein RodZ